MVKPVRHGVGLLSLKGYLGIMNLIPNYYFVGSAFKWLMARQCGGGIVVGMHKMGEGTMVFEGLKSGKWFHLGVVRNREKMPRRGWGPAKKQPF